MGLLIRTEMMVMEVMAHVGKMVITTMTLLVEEEEVSSVKGVEMVLLILTRLTPRQAVMTAIMVVVGMEGVEGEAGTEVAVVLAEIPLLVQAWTLL